MKKFYLIAAAAAVLVAGCAKNEVIQNQGPGDAVSFGVYVPKVVTKAGATGTITTDGTGGTTTSLQTVGFGVFAAYTPNSDYVPASSKMNFMWNQQVTYAATKWSYSPIKYWPNQHGASAVSTPVDKLSFFAYAPYVEATATTGVIATDNTWGITGFSNVSGAGNDGSGDPKVHYVCETAHPVDLVWGVVNVNKNWTDSEGVDHALTAGMPYKDLIKPKDNPVIALKFQHALAKFVVDVKAVESGAGLSNISADDVEDKATGTRIYIESLTVTGTNIYYQGDLNLNNTTANKPLWEVTGNAETSLNLDITSSNLYIASTPTQWNDVDWKKAVKPGVLKDVYTELVSGMVIPNSKKGETSTDVAITSVTIVYDVITKDTNLNGNASIVKNTITKNVSLPGFADLDNGKIYKLHLILGMKTVDITGEVEDWTDLAEDIYLPQNVVTPAP